jgi:adhesin transport system membrane fusion protein
MSDRLQDLVQSHSRPPMRAIAVSIAVAICGFLAWSTWAHIDEVAIAAGEVTPQGRIKVVQHLEGGIIERIDVAEGDTVQEGAALMQLSLGTDSLNREEIQVQLDGLILKRARLLAEVNGTELALPPELAARHPDIAESERRSYAARRNELNSAVAVIAQQTRQKQGQLQELTVRLRSLQRDLSLTDEKYAISTSLLSEGLTSKLEHLELEREVQRLRGQIAVVRETIPNARAAIEESEARVQEEREKALGRAQEELSSVEPAIARLRERLSEATSQVQRTEVRSPIDGIVKNLRYNTIGGVVRPGEPILDLVPLNDSLVVEAKLNPVDRGYVREGQPATVKVSSYDFIRYGGLDGEVAQIAADTDVDTSGNPYYRVVVRTDKTYLGEAEGSLPITPGMQATVDIHTGTRSVIWYLVKPVLKLRHEAFRER